MGLWGSAEQMLPVSTMVPMSMYSTLAMTLLTLGAAATVSFFIYSTKARVARDLVQEVFLAGIAALFLGFGSLFLLLWVGVYV